MVSEVTVNHSERPKGAICWFEPSPGSFASSYTEIFQALDLEPLLKHTLIQGWIPRDSQIQAEERSSVFQ
jgi:hypothetical protein